MPGSTNGSGGVCNTARQATTQTPNAQGDGNNDNNAWPMQNINVDPTDKNFNSSTATVTLPTGSAVLFAGLFWSAREMSGGGTGSADATPPFNQMKLEGPTGGYVPITASEFSQTDSGHGTGYGAYANVTDMVQRLGQGTWTGANVSAATGLDRFAGWSLVIAYQNPADPLRDLTIFAGFTLVTDNESVTLKISGFLSPLTGPVDTEIGLVAGEGDLALTGDSMKVDSTTLTDPLNPANNFFNSGDTVDGMRAADRNPPYPNMMGWDLKEVAAPDAIPNGATSASVTLSTNGDTYYPLAISTQTDLYAPAFASNKSVVDLDGHSPARPGDTLQYSLTFDNNGLDAAEKSVLRDPIPAGTAYVPGSINIISGANAGAKTDVAGDDQAEFDGAKNQVVVRLGNGADASNGGTLHPGDSTSLSFDVKVLPEAAGTTVTNQGFLDYTAATLDKSFTYDTNFVYTPVTAAADLSITKTASSPTTAPGADLVFTLRAHNNGPGTAAGATVSDTLPAGTTYVSATTTAGTCAESAPSPTVTVTCSLGDMASGATQTITLTVKLGLDFAGHSVSNTGTISSGTYDPVPGNNTSTVAVPVNPEADMSITKTASPGLVHAGNQITYTLVATNNGPSNAENVTVSDAAPIGTTLVSFTPVPACFQLTTTVDCNFGTMAPGDTHTISIVVRVDPSTGPGTITNSAFVNTTSPDPVPGNNNASAMTSIDTSADVAIRQASRAQHLRPR